MDGPNESGEGVLEHQELPPQHDYSEFDFNRPPFRYRQKEAIQDYRAAYHEIDETDVFEMEYRVFHLGTFPEVPSLLPEGHRVRHAYKEALQAQKKLDENISELREKHPYFNKPQAALAEAIKKIRAKVGTGAEAPKLSRRTRRKEDTETAKQLMVKHLKLKQLYCQRAMTYLMLLDQCPDIPPETKPEDTRNRFHEVEATLIAHMTYAAVRSATHLIKPRRKSGELVMNHVYATCIHVMNQYLEEICPCKDPKRKEALYKEMKLGIIRALCHDYLEDFEHLSEAFLMNKLRELLNFDTIIEEELQSSNYPGIPEDTNFVSRNSRVIGRELRALKKPPRGPSRQNYLHRQIFQELPKVSQMRTFLTKCADRRHNLDTLAAQDLDTQIKTIGDTLEMIKVGKWARSNNINGLLRPTDSICSLCGAALEQISRMKRDHAEEIEAKGKTQMLDHCIINFLEYLGAEVGREMMRDLFGED